MKIKSITVRNLKAIKEEELELNGASIIVTASNNKGKTSLLRGLMDRFRGEIPDIIVREGEEKGISEMELTDGSKIAWSFTKKTENFSFTTAEDIKMTTGVISGIGEKYFGIKFKIDKFLESNKKDQLIQVQKILGLDFSDIDKRFKEKYDERTEANREVKRLRALNKEMPEEVKVIDIELLKAEKSDLDSKNQALKEQWAKDNKKHQDEIIVFNNQQITLKIDNEFLEANYKKLTEMAPTALADCIDFEKAADIRNSVKTPQQPKELKPLQEPTYHDVQEVSNKIEQAYEQKSLADAYTTKVAEYNSWVKEGKIAKEKADNLDKEITEITEEKTTLIKNAKLPEEFEMTDEGLLYNGFPLDENQISTSAKYIAALKLGALALGKLKTLHFDCSALDRDNLNEIQKWANDNDYQLLLERPEFEGGEIKYEILEELG